MKQGRVYLVGAGPGDPGLLTVKGRHLLQRADVVVYDRLVAMELLELAPPTAERIYVGKQESEHTLPQEEINALLVQKSREGKQVVRLKGGDPFVFGRGGEEALYLARNGCAFEIVPGISSATAVPAYAGIPVTHRDTASSFAVVTGHEKPGKQTSAIHWKELATGVDTLVFLMGVGNLSFIVEKLCTNGRDPETPAALIRNGTLPQQQILTGTLKTIEGLARSCSFTPPAVLVVGKSVALRPQLQWFELLPFYGKTIVVTRASGQSVSFMDKIRSLGGTPLSFPTIEIQKGTMPEHIIKAFREGAVYDWIIFTSVNGVLLFFEELSSRGLDARTLHGSRLCAIGPATAEALTDNALIPDIMPSAYLAEGILDEIGDMIKQGHRVLLPRAQGARDLLQEKLRDLGAVVDECFLYRAALPRFVDQSVIERLKGSDVDVITFTSSSTVKNFVQLIGPDTIPQVNERCTIASIGPITSQTAKACGFAVDIEARVHTTDGLLDVLLEKISGTY